MNIEPSGTTYQVWYCQGCGMACKVVPPTIDLEFRCQCDHPVPSLRLTTVTQVHTPKQRPLHALSDEEGRLLALTPKGTRVRVTVTYEGEVTDAWRWSAAGRRGLEFVVDTPDGQRHAVDPSKTGVHIEAADTAPEEPTAP